MSRRAPNALPESITASIEGDSSSSSLFFRRGNGFAASVLNITSSCGIVPRFVSTRTMLPLVMGAVHLEAVVELGDVNDVGCLRHRQTVRGTTRQPRR